MITENSAERALALTGGGEEEGHIQFMADGGIWPDDGPGVIVTVDTHGL
jgi:hypothetical protein